LSHALLTQAVLEQLLLSETHYSDCFSHLRERVAKFTSSDVSILTCENWYWDRDMTSKDWNFRMTEYRGMYLYLHWIYNNKKWDFKMTSKEPEYRLVRFRGVEVQLYYEIGPKVCSPWKKAAGEMRNCMSSRDSVIAWRHNTYTGSQHSHSTKYQYIDAYM